MPGPSTPLKAIRSDCVACMGGNVQLPAECTARGCALWPYRMGKRPATGAHRPLGAVHAHCISCVGSAQEARSCTGEMIDGTTCVLHPYRNGTNPRRRGAGRAGGNPNLTGQAGRKKAPEPAGGV